MSQPETPHLNGRWRATYSWAVKNFTKRKLRVETPYFSAHSKSPLRWKLCLFDSDGLGLNYFIELRLFFGEDYTSHMKDDKFPVIFEIALSSRNGTLLEAFRSEKEFSMIRDKWVSRIEREKIANGVKDDGDILVVSCDIIVCPYETSNEIKLILVSSRNSCLVDINSLRVNAQHTDVILKSSDGAEFKAHRIILSARSSVFKAMFSNDMAEKKEGLVEIREFSTSTLNHFLSYIYSGTLPDNTMTYDDKILLLGAAHKYDIKSLGHLMEEYLIHEVNIANAATILPLSYLYESTKLKDSALKFVCSCKGRSLLKTPQWEAMLKEYPQVLTECFLYLMPKLERYDFTSEFL